MRAIPVASTSADVDVTDDSVRMLGWSFRESAGGAGAKAQLLDAHDANNTNIVGSIGVGDGLDSNVILGDRGVKCPNGVRLNMVSGSLEGCVYVEE